MRMRSLRLSLPALLALTTGMAGTLILLALLEALVLHPIPGVADPERLLSFSEPGNVSYPTLEDLAAATHDSAALDGVAGYAHRWFAVRIGGQADERRIATVVAGDYFGLLRARPLAGRLLTPEDDRAGAPPVAVVSYPFWRDRLGARRDVVGSQIVLNGTPFEVVGVADRAFRGLARDRRPVLWTTAHAWFTSAPTSFGDLSLERRGWSWLRVFGRAADGVPLRAAQAVLGTAARRVAAEYPQAARAELASPRTIQATVAAAGLRSSASVRSVRWAVGAAIGLLLLLAVASATQIFLVRAESRRLELATRLALGADPRRVALSLLIDPLLTALLATVAAAALGELALRRLADQVLAGGVRLGEIGLAVDGRVALLGAGLAVAGGLAAGGVVAVRLARQNLARTIGSWHAIDGGRHRLHASISALQVALSLVLLTGTALAVGALERATSTDLGYRTGPHVAFLGLDADLARLTPEEGRARLRAAVEAVAGLPGVTRASLVTHLPLDPDSNEESFSLPGASPAADGRPQTEVELVGADALALLGIELLRGRGIETSDTAISERVGVVNESFVRRYLTSRNPIGRTLELGAPLRIVGVARNVSSHGPGRPERPTIYLPWTQAPDDAATRPIALAFRTAGDARRFLPSAAAAAAAAAPGVPVESVGGFEDLLAAAVAPQRLGAALFGLFSTVALLLAATGLFGLVAHAAAARRWEMGLRAALGATPRSLVRSLAVVALAPVFAGATLGLALSLPLTFAARGLVVGLERFDLGAPAAATAILLAAATLASALPAIRAARADPATVLRTE